MLFRNLSAAVLALGIGLAQGQAQATTFTLDLTGTVGNGSFSSQDASGLHFDQWVLGLDGLVPFTAAQGDTVNATIALDTPLTIPASAIVTSVAFFLTGSSFPSGDVSTTATTSFFLGNAPGLTSSGSCSTSTQIAACADFFPPNNGDITFDSVTFNFTIDTLGGSADLDAALMSYSRVSEVPEPGTMLLAGLGLLGLATRGRRRST